MKTLATAFIVLCLMGAAVGVLMKVSAKSSPSHAHAAGSRVGGRAPSPSEVKAAAMDFVLEIEPGAVQVQRVASPARATTKEGEAWYTHLDFRSKHGLIGYSRNAYWMVKTPQKGWLFIRDKDWSTWKRNVGFKPE